jgi:hypothetical protein
MIQPEYSCANCNNTFSGAYCSACGQRKFNRDQFHFTKALGDIFSEFSDLDSTLGKTIRTLILKPGKLTLDYLQGKQKSYVGPVKLYLIIITVNFLMYTYLEQYSLVNIELLKTWAHSSPWFQEAINTAWLRSGLSLAAFYHETNVHVNNVLQILLYFLLFLQALILKVQFAQAHRHYMEHLVFALHFMCFGFSRDVALLPIQFINTDLGFMISIATTLLYLFFALQTVYFLKRKSALLHTLIHYTVFFLLFIMTIVGAVMIALNDW